MIKRPHTKDDIETVLQLIRLSYPRSLWSSKQELEETLECCSLDIMTLDDEFKTPIGFCLYEVMSHRYLEIKDMVIHPDYQNFGKGTAYMENFLSARLGVVLCNTPKNAEEFLERLGFKPSKIGYKYVNDKGA